MEQVSAAASDYLDLAFLGQKQDEQKKQKRKIIQRFSAQ